MICLKKFRAWLTMLKIWKWPTISSKILIIAHNPQCKFGSLREWSKGQRAIDSPQAKKKKKKEIKDYLQFWVVFEKQFWSLGRTYSIAFSIFQTAVSGKSKHFVSKWCYNLKLVCALYNLCDSVWFWGCFLCFCFFGFFFFKRKRLDHKTKRQIFCFVGKKCLICPEIKFSTTNKPAPKCLSLVIATLSLQILFETTLLVLLFLRCYCVSCRPKCGEKTLNLKKKNYNWASISPKYIVKDTIKTT